MSALTEREQRALLRQKGPAAAAAQALSARQRSTSAARPSRAANAGAPASPVRLRSKSTARHSRGANAQPPASPVRDAAGRLLSPQRLQRRGKLPKQRSPAGRHVSARVASSRAQTLPKSTAARRTFRSSEDASSPSSKARAQRSAGEAYVMETAERVLEIPPEIPLQAPHSVPIKVLSAASHAGPKGAAACERDTAVRQRNRAPGTEPCTEEAVAASGLAATLLGAALPGPGHASSAPCGELVSCVPARLKRVPGGDPLQVVLPSWQPHCAPMC